MAEPRSARAVCVVPNNVWCAGQFPCRTGGASPGVERPPRALHGSVWPAATYIRGQVSRGRRPRHRYLNIRLGVPHRNEHADDTLERSAGAENVRHESVLCAEDERPASGHVRLRGHVRISSGRHGRSERYKSVSSASDAGEDHTRHFGENLTPSRGAWRFTIHARHSRTRARLRCVHLTRSLSKAEARPRGSRNAATLLPSGWQTAAGHRASRDGAGREAFWRLRMGSQQMRRCDSTNHD